MCPQFLGTPMGTHNDHKHVSACGHQVFWRKCMGIELTISQTEIRCKSSTLPILLAFHFDLFCNSQRLTTLNDAKIREISCSATTMQPKFIAQQRGISVRASLSVDPFQLDLVFFGIQGSQSSVNSNCMSPAKTILREFVKSFFLETRFLWVHST